MNSSEVQLVSSLFHGPRCRGCVLEGVTVLGEQTAQVPHTCPLRRLNLAAERPRALALEVGAGLATSERRPAPGLGELRVCVRLGCRVKEVSLCRLLSALLRKRVPLVGRPCSPVSVWGEEADPCCAEARCPRGASSPLWPARPSARGERPLMASLWFGFGRPAAAPSSVCRSTSSTARP